MVVWLIGLLEVRVTCVWDPQGWCLCGNLRYEVVGNPWWRSIWWADKKSEHHQYSAKHPGQRCRKNVGILRVLEWGMARSGSCVTYALRQLKSPLSNISSLGLAGLKSTGTFVIQGVTHRWLTDVHLGLVPWTTNTTPVGSTDSSFKKGD